MARKLKVYRTPIGFHDAFVAAPTQKAALEAWGSEHNLFARGVADIVTDPELTREPLASPGTIIKRLRGSADEQFAALPKTKRKTLARSKGPAGSPARVAKPMPAPPPSPPPSRAAFNRAQDALESVHRRQEAETAAFDRRDAAMARERKELEVRQARERKTLERERDEAKDTYDRALTRWSG